MSYSRLNPQARYPLALTVQTSVNCFAFIPASDCALVQEIRQAVEYTF